MIQNIKWFNVFAILMTVFIVVLVGVLTIYLVGALTRPLPDVDIRNEQAISVYHVDVKNVTCFVWRGESFNGGVHCIPDWQLSPLSD